MINKSDKKTLTKLLGTEYSAEVLEILNSNGTLNKQGKSHNEQYIRMVFCGFRANKDVELALWELAGKRKVEKEKLKTLKTKVTQTKKPTVGAVG